MCRRTVEELLIYMSNAEWDGTALKDLTPEEQEHAKQLYHLNIRSLEELAELKQIFESWDISRRIRIRYHSLRHATPDEVCVPIDPISYLSKEEQEQHYGDIRRNLADCSNRKHLPDSEFAALCSSGHCFGYSWESPNGRTSSEYWASFQVTALDFDDTLPLGNFLERCDAAGIHSAFAYKTFGYGVRGERFRSVFILTHRVHDIQIWNAIMQSLKAVFPEADNCLDAAHVFRGGKGLYYENYGARNNPIGLIENALFHKYNTDPAHHSDFIKTFAAKTGLCFRGRYLDIIPDSQLCVAENLPFDFIDVSMAVSDFEGKNTSLNGLPCINNSVINTTISQTHSTLDKSDTRSWYLKSVVTASSARQHILKRSSISVSPSIQKTGRLNGRVIKDWTNILEQRCDCFRAFNNHTMRFDHDTRLMLACNLTKLSGGENVFMQGMETPVYSNESQKKWRYDVRKIKQRYADSPYVTCEYGCCPFLPGCQKPGTSFMSLLPRKKWEIRSIGIVHNTTSLEESRTELETAFRNAYEAEDNCVYVIRTDTGIGKTHAVVNTKLENTAVASPTHALNEETYARYSMGQALLWRRLPQLPEPFQREIDQRYHSGFGQVTAIVREWLDSSIPDEYQHVERQCYEYLHSIRDLRSARVVFVTHEKVFSLVNPYIRTIIFDEDPFYSLLKTTVVHRNDLRLLLGYLRSKGNPSLKPVIDYVESMLHTDTNIKGRTGTFNMSTVMGLLRDDGAPKFQSPVACIFSCNFYQKNHDGNICCLEQRPLLPDKKYIILSATANESIYRKLFGDRLRFIDLSGTRTEGTLTLHPEQSYSRFCISQLGEDEMARTVTDHMKKYSLDGVIVYKAYAEDRGTERVVVGTNTPVFCHFGAQYGLNGFSGKRIGIYGVPHKPDEVYKMYGKALGIDCNEEMRICEIQRNGFEFALWSYENTDLREIQLWMVEAELMQAVGRARLVSEPDAAVHIFSNYPLPGCTLAN